MDICIIGEQLVREFRKNYTYRKILVIIDSIIVYSEYLIVWSILELIGFFASHLFPFWNSVIDELLCCCRI